MEHLKNSAHRRHASATPATPAAPRIRSHRHAAAKLHKTPLVIALNLAIVLVLAGGTAAYGVLSKTVTLTVEGQTETIRTFGGTVDDVLRSQGIELRSDDAVSPGVDAPVPASGEITVAFAKPVSLTVDGETTEHTIFDTTVGDVLEIAGVTPGDDAYLSDEADDAIPRDGLDIVVSHPKTLTVKADGESTKVETNLPTVAEVLEEAGVTLDADDEVDPGADAYVKPDQELTVTRIEKVTRTEEVDVDFEVEATKDGEMMLGEKKVVTPGEKGRNREKVEVVLADGKVRDRVVLDRVVLSEPTTQVEVHGSATTPPDSVWDRLAKCESGGNWSINTGNGYYGGLQFSASTWRAVGGTGLPHQHSREVQIKYGKILQARAGWGQWPSCTRKLGLR